jgi:PKD repeat protein
MRRAGLIAGVVAGLWSGVVGAQFVQQGAKLVGTDATGAPWQGSAVAVSADGNTAIVGGYLDNDAAGAAWIFTRVDGVWSQQSAKLVGSGATGNAEQGWSVAISGDGNTAIIGGPADDTGKGAAWVFVRSSGTWSQQGNKLVGGGASGKANQGWAVALSADGNTALVGGPGDNTSTGAFWAFTRSGTSWKQQGNKVVATGEAGAAAMGWSLALSADGATLLAGGPHDNYQAGAGWIFTQSAGKWTQQGDKLVGNAPTTSFIISANATVTAGFTQQPPPCLTFSLSTEPSRGGTVAVNTKQTCSGGYLPGTRISLIVTPDTNWAFSGWSGSGGSFTSQAASITTFTLLSDATVTASFVKQTSACLTLTTAVSPADAGTVTVGTEINCLTGYTLGTPVFVTAAPADGWKFAGWSATGGALAHPSQTTTPFVVTANAAVTATFVQKATDCLTLTAAASPESTGNVVVNTPQNCSGGFIDGTEISLTATPAPGWTFGGWSATGGSLTNPVGSANDAQQGTTVALSADGTTALIGGYVTASSSRSVWAFARSGNDWLQQGNRLATSGEAGVGAQAWSVALSSDGDTAIVAEPGDGSGTGAAWVFTRTAGVWSPQGDRLVGAGAVGKAEQGFAIALSSDATTLLLGGPNDSSGVGATWVFASGATPLCTFALEPTSAGFNANGSRGTVAVNVTSGTGCDWVATSNAPWLTVTGGWSGTGAGQVTFAAAANPGLSRTGTLTIAGQTFTAYQAGSDCTFTLSPASASYPASGGSGSFTITTAAACPWTATTAATWVHLTGDTAGFGNGTVAYAVDASTEPARSATIVVGDQSFAIDQAAYVPPVNAEFTFTPSSPVVGEPIQFTDASTGTPSTWQWDFGDGATSAVQNPTHTFTTAGAYTVTLTAANAANQGTVSHQVTVGAGVISWIPVVSHNPGSGGSVWRSDTVLLNPGTSAAYVQGMLYAPDGVRTAWTTVAPGGQMVVGDVASRFAFNGSAALEVLADQPIVIASRTYDQLASGTVGQEYAAYAPTACLGAGEIAWLPQLTQNAAFRTNISLTNTGSDPASVSVTLFDAAGNSLATYDVDLPPGGWAQENEPFLHKAGQNAVDRGYAEVVVTAGAGIIASASVIDRTSGDPTTVAMVRAADVSAGTVWVPVVSHVAGHNGSLWLSDLGVLNPGTASATVEGLLHTPFGVVTGSMVVAPATQFVVPDVAGDGFGYFSSAALEVRSDQPVIVTSRTYTAQAGGGTVGQDYRAYAAAECLGTGESAWLPQLAQNASFRSNISLTNTGADPASVTVALFDGGGNPLGSYEVTLAPGEWAQKDQPFLNVAHRSALDSGYAKVTATSGAGIIATASVIDNVTNDPTTIAMVR